MRESMISSTIGSAATSLVSGISKREVTVNDVLSRVVTSDIDFDITQGRKTWFKADAGQIGAVIDGIIQRFEFEDDAPKRVFVNCIPRRSGEVVITLTGINCSIKQMEHFGSESALLGILSDHRAMIEMSSMIRAACYVGSVFLRFKNN